MAKRICVRDRKLVSFWALAQKKIKAKARPLWSRPNKKKMKKKLVILTGGYKC
jgi:hypothetical protein